MLHAPIPCLVDTIVAEPPEKSFQYDRLGSCDVFRGRVEWDGTYCVEAECRCVGVGGCMV
ncbi:hypothetical protein D3C81_2236000 [compost metagenome]